MYKPMTRCAMFLLMMIGGCGSLCSEKTVALRPVGLWHVVVFRLNQPHDAAARQQLINTCKSFFREIPEIQELHVGTDLPGTRPHQDSDFDVAVIMGFASPQELAAYQAHPAHVRAVTDVLKPLVRDYTSFDFSNETLALSADQSPLQK